MTAEFRIDAEGVWYYRGMEMSRRDIVGLLSRHLVSDESGRFFIDNGKQRFPVDVDDAPYVVLSLCKTHGAAGRFYILLSDESTEELDPATLRIDKNNVPYCRAKGGRVDARFSRTSYYQLAEHISCDARHGDYFINAGGELHSILTPDSEEES